MEMAMEYISQYGYFAIVILLSLGLIGMPLPDEALMIFVGYLASTHAMSYPLSIIFGLIGSIIGMTVSYTIGKKIGYTLIGKFGKWIGLTPARYSKVRSWFTKYGIWTILLAYFIPGVRHIAGYISGISTMQFKKYLLVCFIGASVWTVIFISIGYFAGMKFLS
ncbi:membrane protein DedA with SNARE-associated domain [Fontibacillus solani]|uniref:Membrane protein DedA with SNARE-associated domain n=1 Tax=Fontibacillus solani TaxID=1572857 RepID=A0A7W3SXZ5_9BACL|nr:DedA family protein [Fontibacillus solani]MBA9088316.1 membrane protein DedA with SNARE-associated domain [Fontibacillus solani]